MKENCELKKIIKSFEVDKSASDDLAELFQRISKPENNSKRVISLNKGIQTDKVWTKSSFSQTKDESSQDNIESTNHQLDTLLSKLRSFTNLIQPVDKWTNSSLTNTDSIPCKQKWAICLQEIEALPQLYIAHLQVIRSKLLDKFHPDHYLSILSDKLTSLESTVSSLHSTLPFPSLPTHPPPYPLSLYSLPPVSIPSIPLTLPPSILPTLSSSISTIENIEKRIYGLVGRVNVGSEDKINAHKESVLVFNVQALTAEMRVLNEIAMCVKNAAVSCSPSK
jgi:hypothetical protein